MRQLRSKPQNCPIGRKLHTDGVSLWFLLPNLLGLLGFILVPFGDVLRRSFFSAMGGRFAGFENYAGVLQNEAFQLAAANTGRFLLCCIPLLLLLSLLIALLLYSLPGVSGMFKTTFLLPMAVPVPRWCSSGACCSQTRACSTPCCMPWARSPFPG